MVDSIILYYFYIIHFIFCVRRAPAIDFQQSIPAQYTGMVYRQSVPVQSTSTVYWHSELAQCSDRVHHVGSRLSNCVISLGGTCGNLLSHISGQRGSTLMNYIPSKDPLQLTIQIIKLYHKPCWKAHIFKCYHQ